MLLPLALPEHLPCAWGEDVGRLATVVWQVGPGELPPEDEMEPYELTCKRPMMRQGMRNDGAARAARQG